MKPDEQNQQRILAALESAQLDALLCSLPHHVLLLTGYWPVMANSVAVATRAGDLHLLLPEDESDLAAQMSAAQRTTFQPGSLDEITSSKQAIASPLIDLIGRLGLQHARLGLALEGTEHAVSYLSQYSYQDRLRALLHSHFPAASILPADALLQDLAAVKTEAQLAAIRLACRIAGDAYRNASAPLAPGHARAGDRRNYSAAPMPPPPSTPRSSAATPISSACPEKTPLPQTPLTPAPDSGSSIPEMPS